MAAASRQRQQQAPQHRGHEACSSTCSRLAGASDAGGASGSQALADPLPQGGDLQAALVAPAHLVAVGEQRQRLGRRRRPQALVHLGPAARFGIPELGAGQRFAGYLVEQREQAVVILCRYRHRRRPQQRAMGAEQAQRAAIGGQADALQQGHAPVVGGRHFVEHVGSTALPPTPGTARASPTGRSRATPATRGRRPPATRRGCPGWRNRPHPAGRVQVADAAPAMQLAAQLDETRHRRQLRIEGVEQAAPAQALGAAQQVRHSRGSNGCSISTSMPRAISARPAGPCSPRAAPPTATQARRTSSGNASTSHQVSTRGARPTPANAGCPGQDAAQDEARIGGDAGGIELAEPGTGDHHGTDVAHRLASGMGFDRIAPGLRPGSRSARRALVDAARAKRGGPPSPEPRRSAAPRVAGVRHEQPQRADVGLRRLGLAGTHRVTEQPVEVSRSTLAASRYRWPPHAAAQGDEIGQAR